MRHLCHTIITCHQIRTVKQAQAGAGASSLETAENALPQRRVQVLVVSHGFQRPTHASEWAGAFTALPRSVT